MIWGDASLHIVRKAAAVVKRCTVNGEVRGPALIHEDTQALPLLVRPAQDRRNSYAGQLRGAGQVEGSAAARQAAAATQPAPLRLLDRSARRMMVNIPCVQLTAAPGRQLGCDTHHEPSSGARFLLCHPAPQTSGLAAWQASKTQTVTQCCVRMRVNSSYPREASRGAACQPKPSANSGSISASGRASII